MARRAAAPDSGLLTGALTHGHPARIKPSRPNPVDVLHDVIAAGIRRREIPKVDPDGGAAMVMGP
jgi:hypothetical protein